MPEPPLANSNGPSSGGDSPAAAAGKPPAPGAEHAPSATAAGPSARDAARDPEAVQPPSAALGADAQPRGALSPLLGSLVYGLSLPERLVRSAFGLSAGTLKELAEFLTPRAFQDSKTYEVVLKNSLNFLITNVGGIPQTEDSAASPALAEDFVARKAVGNFVDLAGLATLHVSPLWVFAIVSDVAYGARSYVEELAAELQRQGVIDEASTIHNVEDLLDAVQRATSTAATTLDQPPLSLQELKASLEATRQALQDADPRQLIPEAELQRYWSSMQTLARQERISLLGVSGALTMQAVNSVKAVGQGAAAGALVAGKLVNRTVFCHYRDALTRVQSQGLWNSLQSTYEPYVEGVWANFGPARTTWTQRLLDLQTYQSAWRGLRSWLPGGRSAEPPSPTPTADADGVGPETTSPAPDEPRDPLPGTSAPHKGPPRAT